MIRTSIPVVPLQELQVQAAKAGFALNLPAFETSAEAIKNTTAECLRYSQKRYNKIGLRSPKKATFKNTIVALDTLNAELSEIIARFTVLEQASPKNGVRVAATKYSQILLKKFVDFEARRDVYKAAKRCNHEAKLLKGEDKLLLVNTLHDFEEAGLTLPKEIRRKLAKLDKSLATLESNFDTNLEKDATNVKFTKKELAGIPAAFLNQPDIKTGEGEYTLQAHNNVHFMMVAENARHEATRKKVIEAAYNLGRKKNLPVLQKIFSRRHQKARLLGYRDFANYTTANSMAGSSRQAVKFLKKLRRGIKRKFQTEQELFRQLKAKETSNPNAQLMTWDWRYYANQHVKEKFSVNTEELRKYFPLHQVLAGLFHTVGASFGITVAEVIPPYKWVDDLRLFVISDTKTSFPLGLVYLDLFPRKHKFGHFAMFNLLDGRKLPNGLQQNPVCAIIGNFTPPRKGQPALLSHEEVVTLFHEFGHALHVILSKGKYSMFAGGNVAQDFSEVHSQLLEEWARDPQTLNLFAADYRNPRKKIPVNILRKLRAAQMASVGHSFSRQLSFGLLDLALHSRKRHATAKQLNKFSNQILNDKSIPMPSTSAFIASFGHLNSCSAGYYGYIWSDAIVANLLPKFASAKHGFLDHKPGLKIRRKIYEIGGKRDSAKCIKDVLGHNFKLKPFLRQLGIQNA